MTERKGRKPAEEPVDEAGGGAMTGATGSLTPPTSEEPFIPAESREASGTGAGPASQGSVTTSLHRESAARHSEADQPASDAVEGGETEPATHGGGYGSAHGLAPGDEAYRMERRQMPADARTGKRKTRGARRTPVIGGDEERRPEEDRF